MAFLIFIGLFGFEVWSADQCRQNQSCGSYQKGHASPQKHELGETFWEWTTHDAVGFYTFWLAMFTAVLAAASIGQGYFLLRGDKTARTAADAALTTANTAMIQARHLESSVAEAARAATAMRDVADQMERSAQAAEEQVTISRDSFITTVRPWIPPNVKIDKLEIKDGEIKPSLTVILENIDHIPAYNIMVGVMVVREHPDRRRVAAEIFRMCEQAKSDSFIRLCGRI